MRKLIIQGAKSFIIGLCVSSLFVSSISYVNAASSLKSKEYYYSAGNNTYKNYSIISTGLNVLTSYAISNCEVNCNVAVPSGYMGVRPMLYNSYGNLVGDGGWSYLEDSGYYGYGTSVSRNGVSNACYAKGWTASWSGSQYVRYETYQTSSLHDFT